MTEGKSVTGERKAESDGLASLAAFSLLVGAAVGVVGAAFRLALIQGDLLRDRAIELAHGWGIFGFLTLAAACALLAAVAAWLVRRYSPHATGSGIPHVEAVLNGDVPPARLILVPVKFVGGLMAIASGMALGREGPTVQMGATVAHALGRFFRRDTRDCLWLLAGGAGAGLATAFNAPIAGAIFVLEELVRRFDTRLAIVTFGTSAGAIAVGRVFLGYAPDFQVAIQPHPEFATVPIYLGLGVVAGLLGVAYNRTILGSLAAADRLSKCPVELRAAIVGAMVALLAWFMPSIVGGGDPITQRAVSGGEPIRLVAMVFLTRFFLGPICYAAKTPGGLFAPLLVLGAQSGLLYGRFSAACFPAVAPEPAALAIVGMAAFFTAVVRSPLTGIVLVIEMTGSHTLLLAMLSACFAAMLIATLLKDPPIYDSLRAGTLRLQERLQHHP